MSEFKPYNPLDKNNLGVSVADALLERHPETMPLRQEFIGAGIYAIYYSGDFPLYEKIARRNRGRGLRCPIYVGKAIPAGARRGGTGFGDYKGKALYRRLKEHEKTIEQAENLNVGDFHCRFLVVDDIWIPLGESLLIEKFCPVWNRVLDGFGNHDPGKGRYNQERSMWDVVHPGRDWATRCRENKKKKKEIVQEIREFISASA